MRRAPLAQMPMDWQIVSPHEFELSRRITRRTHNKQQADHPRLHHYAGHYSSVTLSMRRYPSRITGIWSPIGREKSRDEAVAASSARLSEAVARFPLASPND